jgi:UDP-N-acetylmuramoyl-tripeptide--D-alanyl-D-alanine ligase
MIEIIYYVGMAAAAAGLVYELRRDLMMLQQNSYFNNRYRNWLRESGDTTSAWRIVGLAVLLFSLSRFAGGVAGMVLMGTFGMATAIRLGVAKYKKPLVWTARAKRIYGVTAGLSVLLLCAALVLLGGFGAESNFYVAASVCTACYCGSHILLLAANMLLRPVERSINRRYINDAADRLRSMSDLKIIGVTGSYGKTSTKHFLHRILSEHFDTLMTPGSYNTTLGVVRTIREMLKPYNEVFIVEMGAKQSGDIREICDIVHPHIGIVTAVGPQHLESFGSIEAVQATKFELVDALPPDGMAFVNDDFEYIASRSVGNVHCERYTCNSAANASWKAGNIVYGADGTSFEVEGPDGYSLKLHTRLLGEANISDLLAAVAVAHSMGVPDDRISYAVSQIQPVEHRLSIKRTPGGLTIVDDAYNSNPVGSRMAMEVLGGMTGGKRIVVTPGMIELGERQHELNAEFGRNVARNADCAIIVGRYNRDAISEGIDDVKTPALDVHYVDSFADAQALLSKVAAPGDTVLYENDLPDTFK